MSEPIIVQPTGPRGHMPPWLVDELIEDLRAEGLDARISYEQEAGGGGAVWEALVLWISASAGAAVINKVVEYAFKWLEGQFKKYPDVPRPRLVEIRLYEGDRSETHTVISKATADVEPVIEHPRDFDQFGRWTRENPPEERITPRVHLEDRVRVFAPPTSEVGQQYDGQVGTVTGYPPSKGRYTILMDDGTEIQLRRQEFTIEKGEGYGG